MSVEVLASSSPHKGVKSSYRNESQRKAKLWQELIISGISVGGATTCTNPFDVVKTRLQLQSRKTPGAPLPGLFQTAANIVRDEGVIGLWKGLPPAVSRGFLYGGMRLGLYGPSKDVLLVGVETVSGGRSPQGLADFVLKATAGIISGGVAAGLTSPTELVKTRMQAKGSHPQGTWDVVRQVVKVSGVKGLWRGAVPSMTRAALLTASQVATYDTVKREVMRQTGWGDCLSTYLAASSLTGLVTTTVTNPVDVVKTKMFIAGGGNQRAVALEILRNDGARGFFKGWSANYARLGPQTVITFLISELLRQQLGLDGL
ncbi:uncoupling protein 2 [Volvox africanus]|uniref:Uncoupling protein 2 n=1 Tax=Volvox africanus TaxID=51714 RepID=A0ABQ5RZK7_9CHLO|nr:uncoupling protein 2 [Volvox africanus]